MEQIQGGVVPLGAELGVLEPIGGEFVGAVGHVFAAEDT